MQQSQLDPLPNDLPFRIVSKTIGRGAYASIKKAVPLDAPTPVFAVKLIHKGYALKAGRVSPKQLAMEVSLHSHVGQHANVIEWFASSEDATWRWIAMEYAEGGDLFDKIEADVGVPQDIAHLYFRQLVAGVSFVHSKGVAHRDLKPENILLSASGALKIADFGMATMFEYKGQRKGSATLCGSPPYIAPEILACGAASAAGTSRRGGAPTKYAPDLADIWSCGVILFVLLVGNTPWDEPSASSWEFGEYLRTSGRSTDALWDRVPPDALSLLRGMMSVDSSSRFSFRQIRQHPWYTRANPLLTEDGQVSDPVHLATQMLENLRIDFSQAPVLTSSNRSDAMDVDESGMAGRMLLSSTQPETPISDAAFDFERPRLGATVAAAAAALSSTQPVSRADAAHIQSAGDARRLLLSALADEPSMSQFSSHPGATLTLTQQARRFRDIVPGEALTRFFSHVPPALLLQNLADALHQLNVPLPTRNGALPEPDLDPAADQVACLRVRAPDGRRQMLHGEVQVLRHRLPDDLELLDVRFVKVSGDPLEWRRLFKKVAVLCRECVYVADA